MAEIKRIEVMPLAKIYTVFMAIFGVVIGIFYAIIGVIYGASAGSLGLGAGLGVLAIIVMPIIYGLLGFISGVIGAWMYNLLAGWLGGVKIDLVK